MQFKKKKIKQKDACLLALDLYSNYFHVILHIFPYREIPQLILITNSSISIRDELGKSIRNCCLDKIITYILIFNCQSPDEVVCSGLLRFLEKK